MEEKSIFEQLQKEYKAIVLAKNHCEQINKRIDLEKRKLSILEERVDKKYKDIDANENRSILPIFHKILGINTNINEIEKQEYLHAILEYKECKKIIDLLEYEQQILKEKIKKDY